MTARVVGAAIAVLATVIVVLVDVPDTASGWADGEVHTVYPSMLLPLVVTMAAAGTTVLCRPRVARVAAVLTVITGGQVAGIAVVAYRDWSNVAGGALSTRAVRRAAVLTVAGSVLLTLVCLAAPALYGFGMRLPD